MATPTQAELDSKPKGWRLTLAPDTAHHAYSFVGQVFAQVMTSLGWIYPALYKPLWLVHVVASCAFIAWLPATRPVGVFTDIDDTLTTEGAITPDALAALHRLRAVGLPVFAITGRPAGWSEAFALAWPVDAIVAEHGAVALWRGEQGQLCRDYLQRADERAANFRRLQATARHVLAAMPQAPAIPDFARGASLQRLLDRAEESALRGGLVLPV